jgi:hypothetical protein
VRRFGARVAIVNEHAQPRTVQLTIERANSAETLYEYASQRRLAAPGPAGSLPATVDLDPFDLRVLGLE